MKARKLLSVLLAVLMIGGIMMTAISADPIPATDEQDFSTVGISKTLNVPEGTDNYPKVFTVSFTPTTSPTVTNTSEVPGITNKDITLVDSGSSEEQNAADTAGGKATGTVTFDTIFNDAWLADVHHAGEYVYEISEVHNSTTRTASETYTDAAGVTHHPSLTMDTTSKYQVSVFVINGASGLEIKSLIVKQVVDGTAGDKVDPTITTDTDNHEISSVNFTNTYTSEVEKADGLIVVTKTITGDLADKTKEFPVTVTVTLPTGATREQITLPVGSAATITGEFPTFVISKDLTNNETLRIIGLPIGTTWTVGETQDTANGYVSKITGAGLANGQADADYVEGNRSGVAGQEITAAHLIADSGTLDVSIENHLDNSTPDTGVTISDVAFILLGVIAVAGISFIVIKKSKASV